MKPITRRNTQFSASDFRELERRLGGPVAAARCAGVSYPTWYRRREGKLQMTPEAIRLMELLLRTIRMPFDGFRPGTADCTENEKI